MKSDHQYKRRTMDEARELARQKFREVAKKYLSDEVLSELQREVTITGGSPTSDWQKIIGLVPEIKHYYEFELYKPSELCPYVEKIYVQILVPRNREEDTCSFIWEPQLEPYKGPYYE